MLFCKAHAFADLNRFNAVLEYVLAQSGGQLEVSRAAAALGLARQTAAGLIGLPFAWL